MIEIRNVSKTYSGNGKKAVDSLTWTVPDGSITGFIGPNGAGKSTTLHMITGVLEPDEGKILINGYDIRRDAMAARMQFGFVPDTPDVFLRLRAIEYLGFIADLYKVPAEQRSKFLREVPQRLDMAEAMSNPILSMSHGMRQKVMIMGALIHNPSVWILDEPMVGLDPKSAFTVKEMMHEHAAAGNSVLFSTHVLEVAEKLCDQISMISQGKQIYVGTLDQLKETHPGDSLEKIFLDMTGASQEIEDEEAAAKAGSAVS